MRKIKNEGTFLSDDGIKTHADKVGRIFMFACNVIMLILIYCGVRAIIGI